MDGIPGGRLDEAFVPGAGRPRRARVRVLALGPVLVLWALATLALQAPGGGPGLGGPRPRAAGAGASPASAEAGFEDLEDQRRLRYAYTLLAHEEPARARKLLLRLRRALGDHPAILRGLARAERGVGHRAQAAALYETLLRLRGDDLEALRFFLGHRWEDDDAQGALAVAEHLRALGALEGEAALLARRIEAEVRMRRVLETP